MTNQKHPQAIFVQLHTFCNAECINCPFEFTYNSIHENGRISEGTWNKILSDVKEMDFRGQIMGKKNVQKCLFWQWRAIVFVGLADALAVITHVR